MADVATFVTFNRNRPAASHAGSFPWTFESVDWPPFLHPEADGPRPNSFGGAMRCRSHGARLAQNEKHRLSGEDRRSISSRLPRDHPPCGTPVPEAVFSFPNGCTTNLLHRQRIGQDLRWVQPARIRVRPALRSRGVRTPLSLSAARTRPDGSREAARRPDGTTTMRRERAPGAASGTDGRGHGCDGGSPPRRREECPLTPKKRPGPPSHQDGIIRPRHERLLPEA